MISHLTPIITLLADDRQYILVIREKPTQAIRNGYHTYHSTISSCFEELLSHLTKANLADDKDKTIREMANIVQVTVQEIRRLFKPFEELASPKKG